MLEFPLSAVRELPEVWGQWEGKVAVQGWSQSHRRGRGQSIMKHTNTQLCVDSVPLFLPIHHNRPLIPLRSAHQGQAVPQPHLVEPNSGIILAYGRSRIEQGAPRGGSPGGPHRIPCCPPCPPSVPLKPWKKKTTKVTMRTYEPWKKSMSTLLFLLKYNVADVKKETRNLFLK